MNEEKIETSLEEAMETFCKIISSLPDNYLKLYYTGLKKQIEVIEEEFLKRGINESR